MTKNEMFTVTCDHRRVSIPKDKTCVSRMLMMRRTADYNEGTVDMVYMMPGHLGQRNFTKMTPKNKSWYVIAAYTKDITKANLTVIITDTVVFDEGTYYCHIEIRDTYGAYENLTVLRDEW